MLLVGLGFRTARAVEARPTASVAQNRLVGVGGRDDRSVYPVRGGVVEERVARPSAAIVAVSRIAVAVINPTVETDARAPVAIVKVIVAAPVAPVAGRPEESDTRRKDPDAGDPVITELRVGPVARGPNLASARGIGLLVDRYPRWRDRHRDAHIGRRRSQREPGEEQRREREGR